MGSFKIKFSRIEGHTLSSYSATINEFMILFLRRTQPYRSSLCLLGWGVGDTFQKTFARKGTNPTRASVILLGHHLPSPGWERVTDPLSGQSLQLGRGVENGGGGWGCRAGVEGIFEKMKLAEEPASFPLPGSLAGSDP